MAKHFKWHIKEIAIYPYGGCVKFDEELNKPLKEELLIMLNGPLFQTIFFLFIFLLFKNNLITSRNFLLFKNYHYTLLFFNLLPVYPLDGGKLLNILLSYIIPFKKSNILTIIISVIILVILIFISHNINFALTIGLLLIEIIIYFKRQNYLYNRLLLERYLKSLKFQKVKIINNKENIYKNKTHVIKYGKNYITEKDYLKKRYKGSEKY